MAYFDYHARVKRLILDGKLKSYHFERAYKNIGFALVLCFDDKVYPIREDRFFEYFEIIGRLYSTKKCGNVFLTKPL